MTFYDLRAEREPQRHKVKLQRVPGTRKWEAVRRRPQDIHGVVLHQCGVEFGVADYQIEAAGGDEKLALARRGLGIRTHVWSTRDFFVACAPLDWYINHGNGFNAFTLALEIDGLWGGDANQGPTPGHWTGRIEQACRALTFLVTEGRRAGLPIENLYAHRQSNRNRRADPGHLVWQYVAEQHGAKVLGLKLHRDFKMGGGRPIPASWAPLGQSEHPY